MYNHVREAEEFLLDNSVLCCRIGKQEFGWGLRSRLNRIPFQKHPPGNPGRLGIPGGRGLQYRALPRGDSTETQKGKIRSDCACALPVGLFSSVRMRSALRCSAAFRPQGAPQVALSPGRRRGKREYSGYKRGKYRTRIENKSAASLLLSPRFSQ